MKRILTFSIIAIVALGLSIQVASACYPKIPGCTDPEALNYNPEATVDDGSCKYNVYGCTDPEALNYNPDATINDGTCEYEEPKGSIAVCKIITDSENSIINGSDFPGTEFSITVAGQVITLITPLTLNRSFWGDCAHEGQCIIISGLDITEYFYSEETHPSQGWETPLYNDQFDLQIQFLDDFFVFDPLNDNSDGHIVLTEQRPDRTLVILNKQKEENVLGCTDPVALNYDPEANLDDGSCEYPPELFSISGMKFNDQNDNGVNDQEPGLMDWTIELYLSDQLIASTITDTYGNYSFLNLEPATFKVCELPQVGGWVQTYPVSLNGCHVIELVDSDINSVDFGNHYQGYPILGCTDPVAINYDPEATVDDGTCIYEIPGCTDPAALNYNPQATVNDGSCSYGGSVRPRFSIIKTVSQDFVNAGDTADYTIVVECLGSGVARNTVLKDELPQGFSFEDVNEDGEWYLGDMIRGDKETIIFRVVVSEDAEAGKYVNTARVQASNSNEYKDTAELEVKTIPVKGEEFFPDLEIEKTVDRSLASASSYVLFTVKIKNVGDAPAVNVVAEDILPEGFITENGESEIRWDIALIKEGESWKQSYSVYIQSDVLDGRYENVVVASAENHPKQVKDTALVILGALPHTGINIADILREWAFGKTKVEHKKSASAPVNNNYLLIPKIEVKIPIVLGQNESALEKGAWLLPQTTTPDQMKNTALAAHRYKFKPPSRKTFYLLDKVSEGDELIVYWEGKKYIYFVNSISVVDPSYTEVLADTEEPTLTLITCHPLFSDVSRLVVQGTLIL